MTRYKRRRDSWAVRVGDDGSDVEEEEDDVGGIDASISCAISAATEAPLAVVVPMDVCGHEDDTTLGVCPDDEIAHSGCE